MSEQLFFPDLLLRPEHTFDNFVLGDNAEVFFLFDQLPTGAALCLWGEKGAGKTHILQALAARHHAHTVYTPQHFPRDLLQLAQLHPASLILIDDVHQLDADQQASLFALYNQWNERRHGQQAFCLIVSADRPPLQLQHLREDLRNRLGWGLVYQLHALSDENCRQALEQRAQQKGLRISPDAMRWIFTHCPRDIPTLFSLLNAIDAYALQQQQHTVTIPFLKRWQQMPVLPTLEG